MTRASGAYGLSIDGIDNRALLVDVPDRWHALRIDRRIGSEEVTTAIGADRAAMVLRPHGAARIERSPTVATFVTPEPLSDEAVVHPYLAPIAAIVAAWNGHISIHGGAFCSDGGAWAILGGAAAGKSTLLAHAAMRGLDVLTDDLLVIADGYAMAGPRCIDLRPDAARHLGVGRNIGVLGARERWRVELPPSRPAVPLAGFVVLGGRDSHVTPVESSERAQTLMNHAAVTRGARDADAVSALGSLTMVAVGRAPNPEQRLERLLAALSTMQSDVR